MSALRQFMVAMLAVLRGRSLQEVNRGWQRPHAVNPAGRAVHAAVIRAGQVLAVVALVASASCGGGGDSLTSSTSGTGSTSGGSSTGVAPAANVLSVTVDAGPNGNSVNTLYTTVTVCVPGSTTQCQTIDNIQVDTGSFGLRILAPVLTLSLPVTTAADGNSLVECTQFVDGYSWGPVASADIQLSGETAAKVPIQVIGSTNFSSVPAACSSTGPAEDTVMAFGANGILGIGVFAQDCGSGCVTSAEGGYYYACSQTACEPTTATLAQQVLNPVPLFTTDNNGTIIDLPAVGTAGAATVTGSLIFGIDTESNNASGTQTVLSLDPDTGNFTTVFNGQTLNTSFIDSGSDGLFFSDSSITACSSTDFTGFYCPSSTVNLSATLSGTNNISATIDFSIGSAQTLADDNPGYTAFASLGGTFADANTSGGSSDSATTFDWGLPFFYGRRVATAIEGDTTVAGTGPYVAF